MSRYLGCLAMKGLKKAGDILIPGDHELPRFSETPFIYEVDRIAHFMTENDRSGFVTLMSIFAILPRSIVRTILKIADKADATPLFLAPIFRQINIGVKGVVYTLYYSDLTSDRRIRKMLNWDTHVGPEKNLHKRTDLSTAEKAFALASVGQELLRKMPVTARVEYITRLKKIILTEQDSLMDQIQKETGKSRTDAVMSEIFPILDHLAYLEKFAPKILKNRSVYTPLPLLGKKSTIYFEPMGTSLVISPWNYPLYQAIVPITLSFICGNATVYKPSELTPLTGLVELVLEKAGFLKEWAIVVYGDGKLGSDLINQRPDKIFFTGSTGTGKKIMAQASQYLIPVELELGGKDPMIVFEDSDLHRTTSAALWGALTNAGQSCTSVERLYVHEAIYEPFKEMLVEKANLLKTGVDSDGSTDFGTMTSEAQITVVRNHLEDALSKGAILLTGKEWNKTDRQIPALILDNVTVDMKIAHEETFGPILPMFKFRSEEEVIRMANDSAYGLSASVFSKDKTRADRVARAIHTGNVSVNNVMLSEGNHALPFGGVKNSGFGRYKGEFGFYSFSNIKSVLTDNMSSKIEANWFPYTPEKFTAFQSMMAGLFGSGISGLVRFAISGLKLESIAGKTAKLRKHK